MNLNEDNTHVWDIDHEQRMTDETRDIVWQAFMDWARQGAQHSQQLDVMLTHVQRALRGEHDPYYGIIDQRLTDFLQWHKASDLFYALAQIQREREKAA